MGLNIFQPFCGQRQGHKYIEVYNVNPLFITQFYIIHTYNIFYYIISYLCLDPVKGFDALLRPPELEFVHAKAVFVSNVPAKIR